MIEIPAAAPYAPAILRARKALAARRFHKAGEAYTSALDQLHAQNKSLLRRLLMMEHLEGLLAAEQPSRAADLLDDYLDRSAHDWRCQILLRVLGAEASAGRADWANCRRRLWEIDQLTHDIEPLHGLLEFADSRVARLYGLLAAESGDLKSAKALLKMAWAGFAEKDCQSGLRVVENELRSFSSAAESVDRIPRSVAETLSLARVLRKAGEYEKVARLCRGALSRRSIDSAHRFLLLFEMAHARLCLNDVKGFEALRGRLGRAAKKSPDPEEAEKAVLRLRGWAERVFVFTGGSGFGARLHDVRALIQAADWAGALELLNELVGEAPSEGRACSWFLVAAELFYARSFQQLQDKGYTERATVEEAVSHASVAAELAVASAQPLEYVQSWHLAGCLHRNLLNDDETAFYCFSHANRVEEWLAGLQVSDRGRITFLDSLAAAYEDIIGFAAWKASRSETLETKASLLAAIEAACAPGVLTLLSRSRSLRPFDLPLFSRSAECLDWYRRLTQLLPRDLAYWMMCSTSDRVHHLFVGNSGLLEWVPVPVDPTALLESVRRLRACWSSKKRIAHIIMHDPQEFDEHLRRVASLLGLPAALSALPRRIRRLAAVTLGDLGDIPLAALPSPFGKDQPLVKTFALSDVPCLSAHQPFLRLSRQALGKDGLAVHPLDENLEDAYPFDFQCLDGASQPYPLLVQELQEHHYQMVHFDCHGKYNPESLDESYLRIGEDRSRSSRVSPQHFAALPLEKCGTVILGACESGMVRRSGRDEREGFVRSAFAAGAASVLAARWVAEGGAAAEVLRGFHRHLRKLPRDRALQQAQVDFMERTVQGGSPSPHAATWACWQLYGAMNRQM